MCILAKAQPAVHCNTEGHRDGGNLADTHKTESTRDRLSSEKSTVVACLYNNVAFIQLVMIAF
jgi:hypothetical protein